MEKSPHDIYLREVYPIIKEQLENQGEVRFKPRGISMRPLIRQGIDEVIIKKADAKPKKNDIVFYCRDSGDFVLHRLIGFDKNNQFIMRGDNQTVKEYGISEKHVIGIVKSVIRDGKNIDASSLLFNLWAYYSRIYILENKLKRFIRRILCLLKKR